MKESAAVSFLRPGLERRTGRERGCLTGAGECRADGWQVSGRDRRWGRGTEDRLCLLVRTPDPGTRIRGQFWAICREPGFLYTGYLPRIAAPSCDLGCVFVGEDESLKTLETVPRISSHKLPSDKGSSSSLAVQEWTRGERNSTMLSRVSPGKDNLLLSHILLSTYHGLSWPNSFVCLPLQSPLSSRQAGGPVPISARGLTERLTNVLELDGVGTEHPGCHKGLLPCGPAEDRPPGSSRITASHVGPPPVCLVLWREASAGWGPRATTSRGVPELLRGLQTRTQRV